MEPVSAKPPTIRYGELFLRFWALYELQKPSVRPHPDMPPNCGTVLLSRYTAIYSAAFPKIEWFRHGLLAPPQSSPRPGMGPTHFTLRMVTVPQLVNVVRPYLETNHVVDHIDKTRSRTDARGY